MYYNRLFLSNNTYLTHFARNHRNHSKYESFKSTQCNMGVYLQHSCDDSDVCLSLCRYLTLP